MVLLALCVILVSRHVTKLGLCSECEHFNEETCQAFHLTDSFGTLLLNLTLISSILEQ
jgi:hypothetical protein